MIVTDEDTVARLTVYCQSLTVEELEGYCRGSLLAATVGVRIFRLRFPEECATFEAMARTPAPGQPVKES